MYQACVMARNRHPLAAFLVALVVLVSGTPPAAAQEEEAVGFVSGIEDLPLMPGLQEAPEGALVFDTPAGRIVEAYASGSPSSETILAFYAGTLPQLGWRRVGAGTFVREDEALRLTVEEDRGLRTVRFALTPDDTMQQQR